MTEQLKEAPSYGLTATDKLRMLLEITRRISQSLDLQEVLNLVMDTLDSLIPYDAAGIFVLQCVDKDQVAEGQEPCVFRSEAVRGYDIDELSELHLKLGEGFIGSAEGRIGSRAPAKVMLSWSLSLTGLRAALLISSLSVRGWTRRASR